MDQATLVDLDIDKGREVLSSLDQAGVNPKVALWMTTPEYAEGKLVFASNQLDHQSPLKAYEKVAEVLGERFIYALPPVLILKMKDPFIRSLRERFGNVKNVQGLRLGGQMIGNRFVSEAYVYRIL